MGHASFRSHRIHIAPPCGYITRKHCLEEEETLWILLQIWQEVLVMQLSCVTTHATLGDVGDRADSESLILPEETQQIHWFTKLHTLGWNHFSDLSSVSILGAAVMCSAISRNVTLQTCTYLGHLLPLSRTQPVLLDSIYFDQILGKGKKINEQLLGLWNCLRHTVGPKMLG